MSTRYQHRPMLLRCKSGLLLCLALFSHQGRASSADCIEEAAHCFYINPLIIQAIVWQESGAQQHTQRLNTNHSRDVGLMQINSVHFTALDAMGIAERELREDGCVNIFSGTYLLRQTISRYGYSWDGIGNYHSSTPVHHQRYLSRLMRTLRNNISKIETIRVHSPAQKSISQRFMRYCVNP